MGARTPRYLDLRLAHHPQKRSARCFVDGACKRLRRRVPIEVRGALGLPLRTLPSGVTRRFRVHPWSVEPLVFRDSSSRRSGSLGRPFARPSSSSDSCDFAACRAARSPRVVLRVPFRKRTPNTLLAFHGRPRGSHLGGDLLALLVPFGPRVSRPAPQCSRMRGRTPFRFCHLRCPTSTT